MDLENQLNSLFGPAAEESASVPADPALAGVAGALTPLMLTDLWIVNGLGIATSHWTGRTSSTSFPQHLVATGVVGTSVITRDRHSPDVRWFTLKHADGSLIGRLADLTGEQLQNLPATLERIQPWLETILRLDLEHGEVLAKIPTLEARLRQMARQHEIIRADHRQAVEGILLERDARIEEQRTYMDRLEREVQERTAELKRQTERLQEAHERMKRDLEAAALIQQGVLPSANLKGAGVHFSWAYQPCTELGGDSLNFIQLDKSRFGIFVLDVVGHGVPSALTSVAISRMLMPTADEHSLARVRRVGGEGFEIVPPSQVVRILNHRFQMDERNEQYFTLIYGVLDTESRTFRCVSAGHPGAIILPKSGSARVDEHSHFAVGWFPDADYDDTEISLGAGDRIFLYSDGITESINASGEQFGVHRLMESIEEDRNHSLEESVQGIVRRVLEWNGERSPADDISLLAVELE